MVDLVDAGIGVLVLTVVIGAVAIPLTTDALATDIQTVTEEAFTPDQLPAELHLQGQEVVENSETIELYDGVDDTTTTLEEGTDYDIWYNEAELEVFDSVDYNEADGDEIRASYDYEPEGYIDGMAGNIVEYVPLALALVLFVAAIRMTL